MIRERCRLLGTRILDLVEKQLTQVTGEWLLAPTEYAFTQTAGRHGTESDVAPGSPSAASPPSANEARPGH